MARREKLLSRTVVVLLALAGTVLGGAGCYRYTNPFLEPAPIRIIINNYNSGQANLSAVTSRGVRSLGVISGSTSQTLSLDWYERRDLRMRVDFAVGPMLFSNFVSVSQGDLVTLTIRANGRSVQLRRGG